MTSPHELLELSRHLKQERLFINSEREQLQCLNEEVAKSAESLYHVSWISRQQKLTLDRLILADREVTPTVCCQRSNSLEASTFVDAYKCLSYHESKFGEFLKHLREKPKLVASCLVQSEKTSSEEMQRMVRIVMASLYGNIVMPEDEHLALQLLKCLIELQVSTSDNPRRLLRKGSCAFSIIFKLLSEGLFSAKLFLTAALHKPVMQLLMEDEWFYDIDPQRALYRFPPAERTKRFSNPGTEEYEMRTKTYREVTANKLVSLAERFISSIKNNMYCFPQSLSWIVAQLYASLTKAQQVGVAEARAMCADLVFAFFICPAICDPEPFGITSDAPISYIARHNLMQVAQILQVLAISSWNEIDPKLRDMYGKFEKGCMSSLLDTLLEGSVPEQPRHPGLQLPGCARAVILITLPELLDLINFLRNHMNQLEGNSAEKKSFEEMLSWLPSATVIKALQSTPTTTPQPTPPGTPPTGKKDKHSNKKEKRRLMLTPDLGLDEADDSDSSHSHTAPDDVLVVTLGVINECPGMLSEYQVLEQDTRQRKVRYTTLSSGGEEESGSGTEVPLQEKRTRFSLSQDQDSIATSDNLEAISEAASSHSPVGSDIETENDNLSDMVSANVSGRGTPNISGRDTPISQAGSQAESVEERRAPDLPVIVQKTNREDVTERFGKFEIKAELERDETKSTVSDTWSTDVLAGDSEPPEQTQMERLEEVTEEGIGQNLLGVQEIQEVSETASDAWSTDVLASDTSEKQAERLLELDQTLKFSGPKWFQASSQSFTNRWDEVASVSSRSQGPESEAGDPQDQSEDTPQPSGSQSPCEGPNRAMEMGGADGGAMGRMVQMIGGSQDNLPPPADFYHGRVSHEGRGLPHPKPHPYQPPLLQPSRPDRIVSDPIAVGSFHGGRDQRSSVPEAIQNFHYLEQSKFSYAANPRASASFKYAEGKATSALQVFDPLARSSRETSPADGDTNKEGLLKSSECGNLGSSTQTLVPDTLLVSPDQGFASPGNDSSTVSTTPQMDQRDRDSGVPPTPQDGSIDMLANEVSEGLKLTEQQNVNIDANRLSGLAGVLNLLDPLLPDGASESLGMSRARSSTEGSGIALLRNNPFTRLLFNEQGARPKTVAATPRISLQVNNHEVGENNRVKPGAMSAPVEGHRMGGYFDRDYLVEQDTDMLEEEKLDSVGAHVSSEVVTKSRSSTESSSSSLIEASAIATSQGKTVGFDTSLPRDDKEVEEDKGQDGKKKTSFLKNIKDRLSKTGKRKLPKPFDRDDVKSAVDTTDRGGSGEPLKSVVDINGGDDILNKYKTSTPQRPPLDNPAPTLNLETSDDILAKYRKQPVNGHAAPELPNQSKEKGYMSHPGYDDDDGPPAYDPGNLESCKAFLDAKKKLRMVLSTADFQTHPSLVAYPGYSQVTNNHHDNQLVAFLKVQLAEAINLQDKDLIAQLHETIRCLRQFDNEGMRKLLRTMKEEYKTRAPYIAYLVRCRQGLLSTLAYLDRLLNRVKRDKAVCNKYFVSVFVRLFLEKRERALMKFIADFQKLTVSDEKIDLVEQFLGYLRKQMEQDPIWQAASENQLAEARLFIERNIMSHVYTHALYPNGDGDILRDQILHNHMAKLSEAVTPTHKDLRIPRMYHYECPWPAAQAEIYMINAYKTPKDKLQCVLRCSSTIMNLLSMANEKSVPAADDFMPVLIFVLIKANPQMLLSTIQYVTSFYEKRLHGEEQYWWMQFCSAIEFIKTMDYAD